MSIRLIDLDDALDSIEREIANVACPNTVRYVLENRPQVKAIPIEWIKKWLGDCLLYDDSVCAMLEDWEEENGQ